MFTKFHIICFILIIRFIFIIINNHEAHILICGNGLLERTTDAVVWEMGGAWTGGGTVSGIAGESEATHQNMNRGCFCLSNWLLAHGNLINFL